MKGETEGWEAEKVRAGGGAKGGKTGEKGT